MDATNICNNSISCKLFILYKNETLLLGSKIFCIISKENVIFSRKQLAATPFGMIHAALVTKSCWRQKSSSMPWSLLQSSAWLVLVIFGKWKINALTLAFTEADLTYGWIPEQLLHDLPESEGVMAKSNCGRSIPAAIGMATILYATAHAKFWWTFPIVAWARDRASTIWGKSLELN